MASEVITLVAVLSAGLAADIADTPDQPTSAFERTLDAHRATLAPTRYASRDDDGSLYVTVTVTNGGNADTLQSALTQLPGVLAVYRKPPDALPD